jgi:hypothetical protein
MDIDWLGVAKGLQQAHIDTMRAGDEHGENALRLRRLIAAIEQEYELLECWAGDDPVMPWANLLKRLRYALDEAGKP